MRNDSDGHSQISQVRGRSERQKSCGLSVIKMLEKLPKRKQEQVVAHLRIYLADTRISHTKGKPGKKIVRFAGAISRPDLIEMEKAIEAGCEQVDANEW